MMNVFSRNSFVYFLDCLLFQLLLLLAVFPVEKSAEENDSFKYSVFQDSEGALKSAVIEEVDGDTRRIQHYFFIGIIDVLQSYNASKMLETGVKSLLFDSKDISSISPRDYSKRFLNMAKSITE